MILQTIKNKKDKKRFKLFRYNLYNQDHFYVSTIEFTCNMLLDQTTEFAKSCNIEPIIVENDAILAEAILIIVPESNYLQIAFFEALENQEEAVKLIIDYAKQKALKKGLLQVIVGLNGHLSYGVGLSLDMNEPNSFDSTYSKLYYPAYFENADHQYPLVAFGEELNNVTNKIISKKTTIQIRPYNPHKFKEEMDLFRIICNKTIGLTYLYQPTKEKHFEELLSSMKFFLKPENLLFAYYKEQLIGFIFWHPDYNQVLDKGKQNSIIKIAYRYLTRKNKITKVKLNAIGVIEQYEGIATMALLQAVNQIIKDKYKDIETNFVWENNLKSMRLNKHLLTKIVRRFMVYGYDVN